MATGRRGIRSQKSKEQATKGPGNSTSKTQPKKLVQKALWFLAGSVVVLLSAGYVTGMILLGTTNPVTATLGHSMNPLLFEGDLAVVKSIEPKDVLVGDVIRIRVTESNQKSFGLPAVILHRVVSIRNTSSGLQFTTKGDNNSLNDSFESRADNITGVMVAHFAHAGYPIIFIQAPAAPVLGIVIVALIVIYILISWLEAKMQAAKAREKLLDGLVEELPLLQTRITELTLQLELTVAKLAANPTNSEARP